ncbi:TadE/TadG family type IV pilus assembly protein [Vibrio atypicus]|uniref:TadE/TadG family type IV pilus assembly protein n=1 Tax=Vibrio atypicus TaxID=558271 RepID=UPI00135AFBF9|nr:TadE/TadG family type IV pilus assembly protein [Vibrio atypicus]
MKRINKQSGHAALLFALIIPGLFGLFTLASDGARAIQTKARIEDAAEIAVLAVAAHNDDNEDSAGSGSGSQVNRKIASDYLEAYLHDMTLVSELKIHKYNCDQIPECVRGLANGQPRFFQYEVEATSRHVSWFSGNDSIQGFGDTFDAKGAATARKYQSEAVDIIFVADYSGSMADGWNGGRYAKYVDLRNIIKLVTDELQKFNDLNNSDDNTVGLTGFNYYTRTKPTNRSNYCFMSQLEYKNNGNINYSKTVNRIFTEKNNRYCVNHYDSSRFFDLPLTDNYSAFNGQINSFYPNHGTASYQGIMRGAQMLSEGTNPRRLLIVLSDGDDTGSTQKNIHRKLVDAGMCNKIREELSSGTSASGQTIKARLAVVGFDYDVNDNTALRDCAGEDNVFKAQNTDDILNKILELITEEIGHLN